jgi:predicted transcriptional regulator
VPKQLDIHIDVQIRISDTEGELLAMLFGRAEKRTYTVAVTAKELARSLNKSESTVRRAYLSLRDKGLVVVLGRQGTETGTVANEYVITYFGRMALQQINRQLGKKTGQKAAVKATKKPGMPKRV